MYHKIRITVVSLVVMMICVLSSSGTLSYFTDTDARTNNFVVGNASTSLALYDSTDKHELNTSDYTLVDGGALKCASCTNSESVDKIPFYMQATNDGNIPVYQRFRVVIPTALASAISLDLPTMDDDELGNECKVETAANHTCSNADYTVTYIPSVTIEEKTYVEYRIVSNETLAVGETTKEWPTEALGIGTIPEDDSLYTCANNNNDCAFGINAYSDAIQTTGFTDAVAAFASMDESN